MGDPILPHELEHEGIMTDEYDLARYWYAGHNRYDNYRVLGGDVHVRIQRELRMNQCGEINWIPWADRLLLGAGWVSLLLVILPFVAHTLRL